VERSLTDWLRKKFIPDADPVSREDYVKAWAAATASEDGRTIVAYLRYSLWQVAAETGPTSGTSEERALWLVSHDARKRVLLDIISDATSNREQKWKKRESYRPIKSPTK